MVLHITETDRNQFVSGSGYGVNLFPLLYIFGKLKAFLLKQNKTKQKKTIFIILAWPVYLYDIM